MSKLKFYFDNLSQPCRAINLFLALNKIDHEPKPVNLTKGEHYTKEFGAINPFHKVPVIEHKGFLLTESVAILRYLSREFKVSDHWYPRDSIQQAKVDEYLEWQHTNTRLYCAMYFQTKFLKPLISGNPPKQSTLDLFFKGMEDTCNTVQDVWLKQRKYLCGEQISVADLLGVCELEQPRIAGYNPRDGRPILKEWMDRVRDQLNPHYDAVHERVYKISSKYKGEPPVSASKL